MAQQQNTQTATLAEMLKSPDEFYDCWKECVEFDEALKEEQRKEYFRRIFPNLASRFVEKRVKQGQSLSYCDIADMFMMHVQELAPEERRVRLDDLSRISDPKKHLAGRLAKFLDSPEENHWQLETQRTRELKQRLAANHP